MTSEDRAGRSTALAPGGGFLLGPTPAGTAATPERLSGEQRAIREALAAFVEREIVPRREALEARDYAAHREVLARLGEAGFLGVEVPAEYGGAGLDRVTAVVVAEALGGTGSFTVTYGAHAGIGTLPLVFFGTDDQRRRYLPGLAAGTLVGAYALTEPGAGSDAMGIRTRATRLPDGRFRLDGAKQFITNAGFADLFTLYAKVDGEAFTAFLVERGDGGLTVGVEEEKMGIHGASTCPLSLDGVVVGPERVLGEVGQGHRVAFNILNVGRFKLAAACLGAMRPALATAVAYARERRAFGRAIADFGLVAAKLVGMATRIYAVESLVYRLAGLVDARLAAAEAEAAGAGAAGISQSGSGGTRAAGSETHQAETQQEDGRGAYRRALEEYAVECSIAKVFASEALNWVVDELVQVHGGYGYIESYPAARAYRDARINRIWEGTNEINRLLVPGTLLRRAVSGRLDLLTAARKAQEAILAGSPPGAGGALGGPLAADRSRLDGLRQATLLLAGSAATRFGTALEEEQEVLAGLADLVIALFAGESALLRAEQAHSDDPSRADLHGALASLVVDDLLGTAELAARRLVGSVASGDDARLLATALRRLFRSEPTDRVAVERRVARAVLAAGGSPV
jgi:alkylation response protein AidB-like acyl-CoA dehydrogenase